MSKYEWFLKLLAHSLIFCALLMFGCSVADAKSSQTARDATTVTVKISVLSVITPRVRVEGSLSRARSVWSFRESYASVRGISRRIKDIKFYDERGATVEHRQLAPGELETVQVAKSFDYTVELSPPLDSNDTPFVSWLTSDFGLLLPGDLLPREIAKANLKLEIPQGWTSVTLEAKQADGSFSTDNADDAVFTIGRSLRLTAGKGGRCRLDSASTGTWAFTDDELAALSDSIFREQVSIVDACPRRDSLVLLLPFPRQTGAERWSAETRGGTVMFFAGHLPGKTMALVRLSQPLAHEIFHLWLPNSLYLQGNYDWFYEGFTQYQSLRTGVKLGWLSFQDFLDAMARHATSDETTRRSASISLIDASTQRWNNSPQVIYNRALILAFLYDLRVRATTSGKRSVSDVFRELMTSYAMKGKAREGNAAVIESLMSLPETREFVSAHFVQNRNYDIATELKARGLIAESNTGVIKISVASNLDKKQRALLQELGCQNGCGKK